MGLMFAFFVSGTVFFGALMVLVALDRVTRTLLRDSLVAGEAFVRGLGAVFGADFFFAEVFLSANDLGLIALFFSFAIANSPLRLMHG